MSRVTYSSQAEPVPVGTLGNVQTAFDEFIADAEQGERKKFKWGLTDIMCPHNEFDGAFAYLMQPARCMARAAAGVRVRPNEIAVGDLEDSITLVSLNFSQRFVFVSYKGKC